MSKKILNVYANSTKKRQFNIEIHITVRAAQHSWSSWKSSYDAEEEVKNVAECCEDADTLSVKKKSAKSD